MNTPNLNIVSGINSLNNTSVPGTPRGLTGPIVKVHDLRSARRLFQKLLREIQTGNVDVSYSRLMIYSLSEYIRMLTITEIENRIKKLEEKV